MYFSCKKITDWILERFSSDNGITGGVENVQLPKSYAYSPFAYTLVGLYFLQIYLRNGPIYTGHYIDSVLLISQGIFSYLGDVHFLGRKHFTRIIDRLMAILFTSRFIIMNFNSNESDLIKNILFIVCFPVSMYIYYNSYKI